jgi:hypothetical protein
VRFFRGRVAVHVVIGVVGFMVGATTLVFAASTGAVKLDALRLADGTNPAQLAKVDASGNVAVRAARQPFQQFVLVYSPGGGDFCEAIVVPSGMRLTIESFSANVFWLERPSAYLRIDTTQGGTTTQVRSVPLEMRELFTGVWAGSVQTLLFTGGDLGPDPTRTYTIHACTLGIGVELRGLVTGHLEPLS